LALILPLIATLTKKPEMLQLDATVASPGPHWGAYTATPDPLAGFKGPLRRTGEEERGRKRKMGRRGVQRERS